MPKPGAVYKDTDTGAVCECLGIQDDGFDRDNHEVEVRYLKDDEIYTHFRDNFRSGFTRVADSVREYQQNN